MATALAPNYAEHLIPILPEPTISYGRQFGRTVLDALDEGKRHVVVDCAGWQRLDFVLLSALVKCADTFNKRGAVLELVNLSPELAANIRELRLQKRLNIVE